MKKNEVAPDDFISKYKKLDHIEDAREIHALDIVSMKIEIAASILATLLIALAVIA